MYEEANAVGPLYEYFGLMSYLPTVFTPSSATHASITGDTSQLRDVHVVVRKLGQAGGGSE